MELRTQAIDRVLEALAPTLSAELDRIIQEAQQNLEVEFQRKLQAAVREAEAASQRMAEVQLEQAVAEAREAVRKQVTEELKAQFSKTLQEASDQLRTGLTREFQKVSTEWMAERSRLTDQLEEWRLFADAQRQLVDASSQSEILARFLKLAERLAPSIAVYISKADGLALWKSRGNIAFPPIVSQGTIDPELFFRQIVVRGKLVAAVCAAKPYKDDGLSFLTGCLERSIESFGLKLRTPIPKPSVPAPPPVETDDEKMHAEARRLARLLVSEIKLYHEQEVRDGRANSDLYERLRNQIEGGREQYRQKVSSAILGTSDYFHEEVVRVLAENDPFRLGGGYPGPQDIRRGAAGR